jgi:organic radical activating enzyme
LGFVIKEIFQTLQGEGALTGRAAVFCRFSGCNLWSGREEDRATATCQFCDTDFVGSDGDGGGRFPGVQAVADAIADGWGPGLEARFVVFTGGEPLLQLGAELVEAVRAKGFFTAIETNGTLAAPAALTGSVSALRPARSFARSPVRNSNSCSRNRAPRRNNSKDSRFNISFCSRWMAPSAPATPRWLSLIASLIRAGGSVFRRTN